MATRRDVIGVGLATAAMFGCAGAPTLASTIRQQKLSQRDAQALLVGEGIALPHDLCVVSGAARSEIPIIPVSLAHDTYYMLKRVFDRYGALAGLSSGASLFCIERIAWDHGMRLTRLYSYKAAPEDRLCHALASAQLLSSRSVPSASEPGIPSYRPSQRDGLVHAWIIENSDSPYVRRQSPQEFV